MKISNPFWRLVFVTYLLSVGVVYSQSITLIENFSNGQNPPQRNDFNFTHNFTQATAWGLGGITLGDPVQQTPPYALELYAGNEDRITFIQNTAFSYIQSAKVWGYASPAKNGLPAGRGRVIFEGTGDSKIFTFTGGVHQWRLFEAHETDVGENGNVLGEIISVTLDAVSDHSAHVMFDDLHADSVTPPIRSNLTLAMNASSNMVNSGDIITYDLMVSNTGPQDAPITTIHNTLAIGGEYVPAGSSNNCIFQFGKVQCDIGLLPINTSQSVSIAVRVTGDSCANFIHSANVTAQALDSNMSDNAARHTATTSLPACADFSVALTALPVPVDVGGELSYEMTITNHGPDTASAQATLVFPSSMTVFDHTPDNGLSCIPVGVSWSCSVDPMVLGEHRQVVFSAVTSLQASGMQTATAAVVGSLPDPVSTNNTTQFKFAMGLAFTFTEIAELGIGLLADYEGLESVDIDSSGRVSFMALSNTFTEYGVFIGDGSNLTQRFVDTDLPALSGSLVYRAGLSCPALSEANKISLVSKIHDPTLSTGGLSVITEVGSLVHMLNADGSLTLLDSQTHAEDGSTFRIYGQPAHWRNGVAVPYRVNNSLQTAGITHLVAGFSPDDIYQTSSVDEVSIHDLNSTNRGLVWEEVSGGIFARSYKLMMARHTFPNWTFRNILPNSIRPYTNAMIGSNDYSAVAYSQAEQDPVTGSVISSFYIKPQQAEIRALSTNPSAMFSFLSSVINNKFRYALKSSNGSLSYFGFDGIYSGPHRVANRVVRSSSSQGDIISGSRLSYIPGQYCQLAINDTGQIAFVAVLVDGRKLIVRADPTPDNDGDGVTDWEESGGANNGDSNKDGIPDSVQPNVTSTPTSNDIYQVGFAVSPNHTLVNLRTIPNPSPTDAPNTTFWMGHFSFEVHGVTPGGTAEVEITMPVWVNGSHWWKYGPTPANPTPHWYDFIYDGTTGAEFDGSVLTLHLLDGGRGDDDLTANGIIVDPGAPDANDIIFNQGFE